MTEHDIYIGSDNRLTLDETMLVDEDGVETPQNSGTAEFVIKDLKGVMVTDGTTDAEGTLSYVATTDGKYQVIIDKVITLLLGFKKRYDLFVTFEQGGNEATFHMRLKGAYQ